MTGETSGESYERLKKQREEIEARQRTSNLGVLEPLFARLRADGGRYLLSVGLTTEERAAQEALTYGGKATRRWLTDEEYAALCALGSPSEAAAPPDYEKALVEVWKALGDLSPAKINNKFVEPRVLTAYVAAENALYKSGRLKLLDGGKLVLSDETAASRCDCGHPDLPECRSVETGDRT